MLIHKLLSTLAFIKLNYAFTLFNTNWTLLFNDKRRF